MQILVYWKPHTIHYFNLICNMVHDYEAKKSMKE